MSDSFRDALILFGNFIDSPWSMIHVRSGEFEMYASRTANAHNPMLYGDNEQTGSDHSEAIEIGSPQLGTVHIEVTVGDEVRSDSTIGWLEVLDERRPIAAGHAGTVIAIIARDSALIEFDEPLVKLI